jgi:hypothetical protein
VKSLAPSWLASDPPIKVRLDANDTLTFVAWDYDSPTHSDKMFSCDPDLAGLNQGILQCRVLWLPTTAVVPPPMNQLSITATVEKLATAK